MAVAPLFIPSVAELKASLRLTGAASGDALAMLDSAIQKVRIEFYHELEEDRIADIVAITHTDNPTTDDGILRLVAEQTELAMVRRELYRVLPVLFMDAAGVKQEAWNEEGFTRRAGASELAAEMDRLEAEIVTGMERLGGEDEVVGSVQGGVLEPEGDQPRPGDSAAAGGLVVNNIVPYRNRYRII